MEEMEAWLKPTWRGSTRSSRASDICHNKPLIELVYINPNAPAMVAQLEIWLVQGLIQLAWCLIIHIYCWIESQASGNILCASCEICFLQNFGPSPPLHHPILIMSLGKPSTLHNKKFSGAPQWNIHYYTYKLSTCVSRYVICDIDKGPRRPLGSEDFLSFFIRFRTHKIIGRFSYLSGHGTWKDNIKNQVPGAWAP